MPYNDSLNCTFVFVFLYRCFVLEYKIKNAEGKLCLFHFKNRANNVSKRQKGRLIARA